MRVNLKPEHEAFIQRLVEGGRYRGASEVVREALRQMEASEGDAGGAAAASASGPTPGSDTEPAEPPGEPAS